MNGDTRATYLSSTLGRGAILNRLFVIAYVTAVAVAMFGHDERFFLASGIGPNGGGDNTIVVFDSSEVARPVRLVSDPELSPLDLAQALAFFP